jgi:hypothetical protein
MDVNPSISFNFHLDSSMDQNFLPPTRQIHTIYTRKPHYENVEQPSVQDQYQLPVPINGFLTTQTSGNLELPSSIPL